MANTITLETKGYKRGRQVIDERIERVRVGDGSYRPAKDSDMTNAVFWLMDRGYELQKKIAPRQRMGTVTTKYVYSRNGESFLDD